jgi:hypothetical protein
LQSIRPNHLGSRFKTLIAAICGLICCFSAVNVPAQTRTPNSNGLPQSDCCSTLTSIEIEVKDLKLSCNEVASHLESLASPESFDIPGYQIADVFDIQNSRGGLLRMIVTLWVIFQAFLSYMHGEHRHLAYTKLRRSVILLFAGTVSYVAMFLFTALYWDPGFFAATMTYMTVALIAVLVTVVIRVAYFVMVDVRKDGFVDD